MTPNQTPASTPAVARRPAFGRTVVDFSGTEPVAPAARKPSAPLRLNKREEIEAAHAAEAKALADAAAKTKADADAALKAADTAKRMASGDYAVGCGHPGCGFRGLANLMFWNGETARCRKHQVVGFVSWGLKKHREDEARRADAEAMESLLRRRRR